MATQVMGFGMVALLFLICYGAFSTLTQPSNVHALQALYYLSSFWGQVGVAAALWGWGNCWRLYRLETGGPKSSPLALGELLGRWGQVDLGAASGIGWACQLSQTVRTD